MHVSVKIPGKVMLTGEYHVLSGGMAIATTVDRYMTVELTENASIPGIKIHSDLWPLPKIVHYTEEGIAHIDPLSDAVQFAMRKYDVSGLELTVKSDLDISYGIGSSSAIRLGVMAALSAYASPEHIYSWDKADDALMLQRKSQRMSSGYDIATQLCGGIVRFVPHQESLAEAVEFFDIPDGFDLGQMMQMYVGGRGAPTKKVMLETLKWLDTPKRGEKLEFVSNLLAESLSEAIISADLAAHSREVVTSAAVHRRFFEDSPHFPKGILQELQALPGFDNTWTFKTSGAGGEDAIILFGLPADRRIALPVLAQLGWTPLDAGFSNHGLAIHLEGEDSRLPLQEDLHV